VLQRVAACCSVLNCVSVVVACTLVGDFAKQILLQCLAVCCSVLQCVAVCCSVLQRVAACFGSSCLHVGWRLYKTDPVAVFCSVLQCVAVCCSVLQCVAVCCSVLQCVSAVVACILVGNFAK